MYPEAYKQWIEMFSDDFSEIWQNERKEMQKIAILLCALQNELKNIQTNVEVEVSNLKQQLKYKDDLEERVKSLSPPGKKKSPNSLDKENNEELKLKHTDNFTARKHQKKESPDLFRNIDLNAHCSSTEASIIDLSISEDDAIKSEGSPTIKKRRKRYRAIPNRPVTDSSTKPITPFNTALGSIKTNLFKTPVTKSDNDLSVIECTPEVVSKKSKISSRIGDFMSKRKFAKKKNSTLTQMFRKVSERKTAARTEDDPDSDETFFDDAVDETKLGITDLIHYIQKDDSRSVTSNRNENGVTIVEELETSSQEIDQFSKGAIFSEKDVQTSTEKPKVTTNIEPVVRGKARKQLYGWSCQQCKNFYGQMKLSPQEIRKKMDECSRHRYKYNPPEETAPGFWDLSIPPENQE